MTHKYSLSDIPTVDPDTTIGSESILISGDSMSGKENIAYSLLQTGVETGDATVVISPNTRAKRVYEKLQDGISSPEKISPTNLGVIDCTGNSGSTDNIPGDVQFIESTADLTGIGIELSKQLENLSQNNEAIRVALLSISPLIMYTDVETTYRFLHVLTARLQAVDALGVFVLDTSAHEKQTLNLIRSLFDIQISMSADADPEMTGF